MTVYSAENGKPMHLEVIAFDKNGGCLGYIEDAIDPEEANHGT